MADIFGFAPHDYAHYKAIDDDGGDYRQYVRQNADRMPIFNDLPGAPKDHNFDYPRAQAIANDALATQAVEGPATFGTLRDNMTAFDAQVQRIMYEDYRLPDLVPLKTNIDEGANATGFDIMDFQGRAAWIGDPGTDVPRVSVSVSNLTYRLRPLGAAAEYTDEQLRNARFANIPLTTTLIEQAVRECQWFMEDRALNGDTSQNADWRGLLNQQTRASASAANPERIIQQTTTVNYTTADPEDIGQDITAAIGALKNDSRGLVGRRIGGLLNIGLPPSRMLPVVTKTLNDKGADISIQEHVNRHNTWTNARPGNTINWVELNELETAGRDTGTTNNPQPMMVLWVNNPAIMEYAISIQPRIGDEVRDYFKEGVPVYAKAAPALFVKYAWGMRYVIGI